MHCRCGRLISGIAWESVEDKQTIPLTLTPSATPDAYRLAPDDILGVYIEASCRPIVVVRCPRLRRCIFPPRLIPWDDGCRRR